MRLKLKLKWRQNGFLKNHYKAFIQAFIYKMIQANNEMFSYFLHNVGYKHGENKTFKHFTFSDLYYESGKALRGRRDFHISTQENVILYLSFSIDDIAQHFIQGMFMKQKGRLGMMDFEIVGVEIQPKPTFLSSQKYELLSPIFLSQVAERDAFLNPLARKENFDREKDKHQYYYCPLHFEKYKAFFFKNLKEKIESHAFAHGEDKDINTDNWEMTLEQYFSPRAERAKPKDKRSKLIGHYYSFTFLAPVEVHELLYECGVGSENALGFGMVEVIR
ncbi:CRISPR-associated endoribonuclease Cas6 [Flammeovirga sp. EKP202]|uniref:CRISPR-associated endoribonuclease Cas6 n=1 Tax=Flammeovirga sp. EKP202 TaxID=2770592 RepID=UPI00165FCBAC|nr:CRISPR-associated endoribonuclease Cas6 [Flammeovirga sp. EKP202]MBD0402743.1 CRISPR-associated endoribonuclease Cas6 [Flammeovirga sp. EKP202]